MKVRKELLWRKYHLAQKNYSQRMLVHIEEDNDDQSVEDDTYLQGQVCTNMRDIQKYYYDTNMLANTSVSVQMGSQLCACSAGMLYYRRPTIRTSQAQQSMWVFVGCSHEGLLWKMLWVSFASLWHVCTRSRRTRGGASYWHSYH
jgi:hypothetical protein